ncbi:GNAT family N-acetyltransferase [Blastopirellula sp. J2-11]|uniref:GNAT family N-acetyltransferase n=1 Tax=Blastopirellula sp. J2-11 TaxID=2943192 RepID=UPI003967208E
MKHLISIRIASAAEREQVRSIRDRAFVSVRTVYSPTETATPKSTSQETARIDAIASIQGLDAGVIGLYSDGPQLRITGLGVLPALRKRGVASGLLNFAERVAIERDCRTLGLFTILETGNVEFFLRLSFAIVDEQLANWCESDRFDALHEVEMRRDVR